MSDKTNVHKSRRRVFGTDTIYVKCKSEQFTKQQTQSEEKGSILVSKTENTESQKPSQSQKAESKILSNAAKQIVKKQKLLKDSSELENAGQDMQIVNYSFAKSTDKSIGEVYALDIKMIY